MLRILKNRTFGESAKIGLNFHPACRRYVRVGEAPRHYGWEWQAPIFQELQDTGTEPF